MKPISSPVWLKFVKWDLRTVIAMLLVLGVVITFVVAAPDASAVKTFDFGTASAADIESGATGVAGGAAIYPKTSGGFTYGWDSSLVQSVSRGSAVADKINRDYNFNPGGANSIFKISGLASGGYNFRFYVGDSLTKVATQIKAQGRIATLIKTSSYGSVDLPISVVSSSEIIELEFSSASVDASWAINGVRIYSSTVVVSDPSFSMSVSPATQSIRPGGTAVYSIGISPLNNYGSTVDLSVSGLVAGITATLIPAQLVDLPGSAELRLSTTENVSALPYEFLIKAKGNDAMATTKNMVVKLSVSQSGALTPEVPIVLEPVIGATVQVPGKTQSTAEREAQFDLIDSYVAAEASKLVSKNNVGELQGISTDFTAFPIAPDMPAPVGMAERSLQFLTRIGIIGVAVDNAPRGVEDSGPKSLWRRILDGIAQPLGG